MRKPQRLQQKIDALDKQWKTLNEKLSKLRQAHIVETDVSQQIKLESQIAEIQGESEELERQIDELEALLAEYTFEHVNKLVFINADVHDAPLCEKVCRLLKEENLAEYKEYQPIKTAQSFRDGQSQAVRLLDEFPLEGNQVSIKKVGNVVVLIPEQHPWHVLFESFEQLTDNYMEDREQPSYYEKELIFV